MGVPITLYKQGLEQHIGRAISEKEFNMLYSGWAYRYAVVTDHDVKANTVMVWKLKGYIPLEAADNLSNYLITGWRITRTRGKTNASEQITAARMPQKGTTLRGKDECGGNTRRVIGEH